MYIEEISSQHYVGEKLKVFTTWEGDKRWQDVTISAIFPFFAEVYNGKYRWCIHWHTFLDFKQVICGG